jgi:hypothetical protein
MGVIYYTAYGEYQDYRPVGRFRDGEWEIVLDEAEIPWVYEKYDHPEKTLLLDADGPTSFAFREEIVPRDPKGENRLGPTFQTLGELSKELEANK